MTDLVLVFSPRDNVALFVSESLRANDKLHTLAFNRSEKVMGSRLIEEPGIRAVIIDCFPFNPIDFEFRSLAIRFGALDVERARRLFLLTQGTEHFRSYWKFPGKVLEEQEVFGNLARFARRIERLPLP